MTEPLCVGVSFGTRVIDSQKPNLLLIIFKFAIRNVDVDDAVDACLDHFCKEFVDPLKLL